MSNQDDAVPRSRIYFTNVTQGVAWVFAKLFTRLFFSVQVEGLSNLKDTDSSVIFAANHSSDLDSVLIRTSLPLFSCFAPLFAVGRSSTTYKWEGWRKYIYTDSFFRFLGAYPAKKGTRNYGKSLKTFVDLGNKKQSILIFIGGRQKSVSEPIVNRGGTAYLSHATGLAVVPVTILGTDGLTRGDIFFARRKIKVIFSKPISKDKLFNSPVPTVSDYKQASKKIILGIEDRRCIK